MVAKKSIRIFTHTFEDMTFNPLYEQYCRELEKFLNEGFEFEIFMSGDEKPVQIIKTIDHFRNFKNMYVLK